MVFSVSIDMLDQFAAEFWRYAGDAKVFAFHGEMGAGKTTVIKSLSHFKGIQETASSPTFSIINEYSYRENGQEKKIFHMDLYRLKDEQEVIQAGVEDCLYNGDICLVEWPEKAPSIFDDRIIHVHIETISETERRIQVKLPAVL
jgi:tRNA threonylcarbamoyladenosine biosynthesis protein TsaE